MGREDAHAVLILLHFDDTAILEGPPDHVCLMASALDVLGLLDCGPEGMELGQLDEMPDVRERSPDNGALNHFVGGGDAFSTGGSHDYTVVNQICSLGFFLILLLWVGFDGVDPS
jgi:hypothetical protein